VSDITENKVKIRFNYERDINYTSPDQIPDGLFFSELCFSELSDVLINKKQDWIKIRDKNSVNWSLVRISDIWVISDGWEGKS